MEDVRNTADRQLITLLFLGNFPNDYPHQQQLHQQYKIQPITVPEKLWISGERMYISLTKFEHNQNQQKINGNDL